MQGETTRGDHVEVEFAFQFARADRAAGVFGGEADDDVAQLAYVAGEMVVLPEALRIAGQVEGSGHDLARKMCAEVFQQRQFVFALLTQRRHMHGEYRQAVVEVTTEAAFPHFAAQITVGGGDDTGVGIAATGFADALEFAVFQHTQQLGLKFQRQFADFVEEQRAFTRVLEVAGVGLRRAGERALRIAEQGGLDQGGGDGRAIESQIGLVQALRPLVQTFRDQLLAATGFAFDQHRKWRVRIELDLVAQFIDRETVADDAAGRRHRHGGTDLALILIETQGGEQGGLDPLRFRRFADEVDGTQGAGMTGIRLVVLPGEHQNFDVFRVVEQVGDEGEAFVRLVLGWWQAQVHQGQGGGARIAG